MPHIFIIAGPNGAGKTTFAKRFLPQEMRCREFVNADMIAAGLSPFDPEKAAFEAARLMLGRLRELAARREDFSFETTLSGRAYAPLLREFRAMGYYIELSFLWIQRLEIVNERVRQRVSKGGHNIPDDVQQRRFHVGVRNLVDLYRPLIDTWRLYDNTDANPYWVAEEKSGILSVRDAARLDLIERTATIRVMPPVPIKGVEEPAIFLDEGGRAGLRALRKAYADVVFENLRFGLPIIQWREDLGVVKIPAELLVAHATRIVETNGERLPDEEEKELLRAAQEFLYGARCP